MPHGVFTEAPWEVPSQSLPFLDLPVAVPCPQGPRVRDPKALLTLLLVRGPNALSAPAAWPWPPDYPCPICVGVIPRLPLPLLRSRRSRGSPAPPCLCCVCVATRPPLPLLRGRGL